MQPKKHPEADLEKKKGLFIQIGLIFALAIVWIALEWRNYETNAFDLGALMMEDIEEEIIPITEREIKPPPPPPPVEELIIVEDEEEIEEELEVEDMEVDEDTEIEIIEEESIESVNVTAIVVSVDTDETPSEGVIEDTNGAN